MAGGKQHQRRDVRQGQGRDGVRGEHPKQKPRGWGECEGFQESITVHKRTGVQTCLAECSGQPCSRSHLVTHLQRPPLIQRAVWPRAMQTEFLVILRLLLFLSSALSTHHVCGATGKSLPATPSPLNLENASHLHYWKTSFSITGTAWV